MNIRIKIFILLILVIVCVTGCNINVSNSKSIKKISGSSTNWTGDKNKEFEFKKGQIINFHYNSELKSGELSVQILNPSKEVIQVFAVNKEGNLKIEIEESGTYIIEIKGNEFKGNYQIEWQIND